jgi:hypothetical protein
VLRSVGTLLGLGGAGFDLIEPFLGPCECRIRAPLLLSEPAFDDLELAVELLDLVTTGLPRGRSVLVDMLPPGGRVLPCLPSTPCASRCLRTSIDPS